MMVDGSDRVFPLSFDDDDFDLGLGLPAIADRAAGGWCESLPEPLATAGVGEGIGCRSPCEAEEVDVRLAVPFSSVPFFDSD